MNPTKVFLSYSHFLVAVPKNQWFFSGLETNWNRLNADFMI
ncbi:putative mitomycin resistance protein [Listeria monocytogenes FSL F2-208]|nr:putative mitomycin resistance protein [Listeria monocytogenes FSL F2-208]